MNPRKLRKRHHFMVQPKGSEKWIECKRSALSDLRKFHGKEKVKVDTIESATSATHFIEILFDPTA